MLDQAKYQMLGGWDQLGASNTSFNSSQDLSEEELSAYIELVHEEIMRTEVELLKKQHKSEKDSLLKQTNELSTKLASARTDNYQLQVKYKEL